MKTLVGAEQEGAICRRQLARCNSSANWKKLLFMHLFKNFFFCIKQKGYSKLRNTSKDTDFLKRRDVGVMNVVLWAWNARLDFEYELFFSNDCASTFLFIHALILFFHLSHPSPSLPLTPSASPSLLRTPSLFPSVTLPHLLTFSLSSSSCLFLSFCPYLFLSPSPPFSFSPVPSHSLRYHIHK